MVTEEVLERNKQQDEDDGCGRDYYDGEGIPVHVMDSGQEIKLPRIPQFYYGVKANGEHCRYPICEEREETIDDLPAGVHTGPPGYLREVWDYARKAAYQARAKAAEAALAHTYERELKLQLFFLNQSMEAWKHKALHLMRCSSCFGNSTATTSAIISLPSPPSTMPPAAAVTVNPMPDLMQANAPIGPSVAPVEAPSSTTPPPPLPSPMVNGAAACTPPLPSSMANGAAASTPPFPSSMANGAAATSPPPLPLSMANGAAATTPPPLPLSMMNGAAASTPPFPSSIANAAAASTPPLPLSMEYGAAASTHPPPLSSSMANVAAASTPLPLPLSMTNGAAASTPPPLPSSMANGAHDAAAAPLMTGATVSSLHNPTTTDAFLTTVSSIPQLPPPELKGKGNKGNNGKPKATPKAKAKGKAAKRPTPKKKKNNNRKVGGKSKSTDGRADGGEDGGGLNGGGSLGLMWNPPKKKRT